MTLNQSRLNPKVIIKQSSIGGRGFFSCEPISKGEKIVEWGGEYVNKKEAEQALKIGKLVMQWDDDLFSIEDRGEDDGYFINHSCEPNTWMDDAYTISAKRDIKVGEEITADYAMWEARPEYISKWECNCGSKNCRKRVNGDDWKKTSLQKEYRGHFSPLINKLISGSSLDSPTKKY